MKTHKLVAGCLLSSPLLSVVLGVRAGATRQEKILRGKQYGGDLKALFLFSNNTIDHIVLTKKSENSHRTNKLMKS